MNREPIRAPAVAGTFYPDNPVALRRMVEDMLARTKVAPAQSRVRGIVAPHAGFVYSGPTAAAAFRRVADRPVKRAIILGCSHHFAFDGASIVTGGAFETPLGEFPVDEPFAAELARRVGTRDDQPHRQEHALEVELPFLAVAVGLVPIVPVLFGSHYGQWHEAFAHTLADMAGDDDLIVASSDLSHYLTEPQANLIDRRTIDTLLRQDVPAFMQAVDAGDCSICSAAAVATAMTYSLRCGASDWSLLDYRTSARASGDASRVVGYAAVSMEAP